MVKQVSKPLLFAMVLSEVISLFLLYKIWRGQDYLIFKILGTAVGLVPLLGPIALLFAFDNTPPQPISMQNRNRSYTGEYAYRWLTMRDRKRPVKKKAVDERDADSQN